MAKKKNKNKPLVDITVETDEGSGPPSDPNVPDLPTPKVNVHVSNANNNANANLNANAAGAGGDGNKSLRLYHDHNHHHSHYARSVDRNSTGGEKVTETKQIVDVDAGGETTETKIVKETSNSVKVPTNKASSIHLTNSPAGSVKSLRPTQPPVKGSTLVFNISVPQAEVQPAPALAVTPPTPIPAPTARPPSIAPATVPLPPSVPPSPAASIRSLAPSRSMQVPKAPRTVIAGPIKEEAEDEIEETTVVTTKRKIRKSPSPPLVAPLPLPPTYAPPGTPQVVADPTWKPMPDPRPVIPSRPASVSHDMGHGFVETITTETVRVSTPPKEKEKSSFFDKLVPKFLKPTDTGPTHTGSHIQVRVQPDQGDGSVKVDVDTSGDTAGNATTIGGNGARTAALGNIPGEPTGTKAGIRPIPIIDYKALITSSPPRRRPSLPPVPAAPKTIATVSAHLVPDSHGNVHYNARLRDHTGVQKADKGGSKTTKDPQASHNHGHGHGHDKDLAHIQVGDVDIHVDKEGQVDTHVEVEEVETRRHRKERERRERAERREPLYKSLKGAYPAPMSERYAMPPAMEDIQNAARERYERRAGFPPQYMGGGGMEMGRMGGMGMGIGPMGMGGMGMGMGPPYPPPGPMTMPRPPPFMGQRPPMFAGTFPPYPVSGMGMPMNNSVMGMGMGAMGYGQGMPGWNGQGYGWMGNPRFPGR